MANKKVILCVLDGWGISNEKEYNAIATANTPNFDYLWNNYPHAELAASGNAVGLPIGQMGNSEIGHLTIGAGRIVYQGLEKINRAFKENKLQNNDLLKAVFEKTKNNNSAIHIKGLFSPGGVHSHSDHFYSFIELARKSGAPEIVLHLFTDGRDTPPQSAEKYVSELEIFCKDIGKATIASLCGRYWAMDRDNNWDRIERAFQMLTEGRGKIYKSPASAIQSHYEKNITDEFIEPSIIANNNETRKIKNNDAVFFMNFRADRAKQLAKRFSETDIFKNISYITMSKYDSSLPHRSIFEEEIITGGLGEILSSNNKKQLRIAETEKYPHVTYFFNGGREKQFKNEERILINSNKIATHDLAPEMKAKEIADAAIDAMKRNIHEFILLNFANPDMVGHSGKLEPTIKAIETVDNEIGKIIKITQNQNYTAIITADHGNAEKMFDIKTKKPHTAHTENKVPLIILDKNAKLNNAKGLSDIAKIVLDILQIKLFPF